MDLPIHVVEQVGNYLIGQLTGLIGTDPLLKALDAEFQNAWDAMCQTKIYFVGIDPLIYEIIKGYHFLLAATFFQAIQSFEGGFKKRNISIRPVICEIISYPGGAMEEVIIALFRNSRAMSGNLSSSSHSKDRSSSSKMSFLNR